MKTKIRIRTPKGQAKKANKKIRRVVVGFNKVKIDSYVNKDDSEMIWDIEGKPRSVMKIIRNAELFHLFAGKIIDNRIVKRGARAKGFTDDQIAEVKDMIENGTTIKVIKAATAQEMEDGKTWWDRIKEKYEKFKED